MRTLASMPSWVVGTLIIGLSVLLAVALTHVVRRHIPHAVLKENTEFVGFTYAVLGVIYGVILAFTVVVVWEQFSKADRSATEEVTYLSELWRDAQVFPAATRTEIQRQLLGYARSVVRKEWATMARHGTPNSDTEQRYEAIWDSYYTFHPQSALQKAYYGKSLSELNEMGRQRRMRLLASQTELPPILWVFLITGGVLTVAFLYFFAPKYVASHALVTASLAGLISFSLFLVMSLQFPFTGDVSVKPDAFRELIVSFKEREGNPPDVAARPVACTSGPRTPAREASASP